jgi:hypothetical protein
MVNGPVVTGPDTDATLIVAEATPKETSDPDSCPPTTTGPAGNSISVHPTVATSNEYARNFFMVV